RDGVTLDFDDKRARTLSKTVASAINVVPRAGMEGKGRDTVDVGLGSEPAPPAKVAPISPPSPTQDAFEDGPPLDYLDSLAHQEEQVQGIGPAGSPLADKSPI